MNRIIPVLQSITVIIIGLSIIGIHGVLKEDNKPVKDNNGIEIVEKQEGKSDNTMKQEEPPQTVKAQQQAVNNNQATQAIREEKKDQENLKNVVEYAPEIQVTAKATGKHTLRNVQDKQDKIILDKTQQVKRGKTYVITFKNDDVINVKEI